MNKTCQLWPCCGCHETLERWATDLIDEEKIWELDVLEAGEVMVFISLCCVARHCPDRATKKVGVGTN
jgi:hypothetical protein